MKMSIWKAIKNSSRVMKLAIPVPATRQRKPMARIIGPLTRIDIFLRKPAMATEPKKTDRMKYENTSMKRSIVGISSIIVLMSAML